MSHSTSCGFQPSAVAQQATPGPLWRLVTQALTSGELWSVLSRSWAFAVKTARQSASPIDKSRSRIDHAPHSNSFRRRSDETSHLVNRQMPPRRRSRDVRLSVSDGEIEVYA